MNNRNWLAGSLALLVALVMLATVAPARASENDEPIRIKPGECAKGEECAWCVYKVEDSEGEECPELRKLCLMCGPGDVGHGACGDCPDVRELTFKKKDCTLTVALETEMCEDCPKGVPTYVDP